MGEEIKNTDGKLELDAVSTDGMISELDITNVTTGDKNRGRYLYYQLKQSMRNAKSIDIVVSFLMESGVKMILSDLKQALSRDVKINILTGNYLGITQPSALYLIKHELGDKIDLRFYNDKSRSFHPKAYFFHYENRNEVFIGSSNISRSALTSGIEWNYRLEDSVDLRSYQMFYSTFVDLFNNHSIIIDDDELDNYSKNWHRPAVSKDLAKYDTLDISDNNVKILYEPRGAQIEALYALEKSRAEGASKALIQAATGIGKTYLAAFDSKNYKRILFVAHREEILKQAAESFRNVRNSDDYGFFDGKNKDTDKSVIFASVGTLGDEKYLSEEFFAKKYFDYMIIDEFHHSVTKGYQNIIKYFEPEFMLGLTATPERMDGKNIYEICDYNVPYEISLRDAINKGMLVPFHYYGIYDDTDYSKLHIVKGKYAEKELTDTYKNAITRYELIYKNYMKYGSKRAIGFCCSREHAEDMAREFCKKGIKAVAVYSNCDGEFSEKRDVAIRQLKNLEINVIFSVDMFNEGVDVAALDMVMFLRPTESPVVFLQQLGRGLRLSKGKTYLNVLDFIGNYEKAGIGPKLLMRAKSSNEIDDKARGVKNEKTDISDANKTASMYNDSSLYPDDCFVDFDFRIIDIFKKLDERSVSIRQRIVKEYERVKEILGKVPTRVELFTYMDSDVYEYCIGKSKENIFKDYLGFLNSNGDLNENQQIIYGGIAREFIKNIENTAMTKVYKMPVLASFCYIDDDNVDAMNTKNVKEQVDKVHKNYIKMELSEADVLKGWKKFFDNGTNWKDFGDAITREEYMQISDKKHLSKIKQMPVKYLLASGEGFFVEKEGYVIALSEELRKYAGMPEFATQMRDVCEYRAMDYYRRRYEERRM
ncbi:DEAD/DEAH box helicase family protein [Falcatimonas sp. MSJ-15]|uniref:DEAD/DEAH box helicase family protein n=1 Tax=Falcatimonas sp. MSJ-15 TaxID=2841515 RepID=UPI00352FFE56